MRIKLLLSGIFILFFLSDDLFAGSKIYLIRHASVQIENPGWCNVEGALSYKEEYNTSQIYAFDAEVVLNRISYHETCDTVFCSPQLRAVQTANQLFNDDVILKIDENLRELDYPIILLPLVKLPIRAWLVISRFSWTVLNRHNEKPSYNQRKTNLKEFSKELVAHAEENGISIVIAHGMVNLELIRILKKQGWKFEQKEGLSNLAVNCLVK
ncbi:MAG: hypothetical protein HN352_09055 [Bacteroidetes bacterium]|jgi:broad specificity phosphatase PhoE|nr:hypothetical protein [Bacteroidota bacterium]MBT3749840.1 hypothetical protein [Bacteroidota bacterium]MBT4401113.1 hypothetical protein [Bacteroidota bacterium]MBT4410112.1 hypothetical protein [Bacteroidota bacterium]MBT5427364.1 hypothetical protein [Bacteroidota bacterium]